MILTLDTSKCAIFKRHVILAISRWSSSCSCSHQTNFDSFFTIDYWQIKGDLEFRIRISGRFDKFGFLFALICVSLCFCSQVVVCLCGAAQYEAAAGCLLTHQTFARPHQCHRQSQSKHTILSRIKKQTKKQESKKQCNIASICFEIALYSQTLFPFQSYTGMVVTAIHLLLILTSFENNRSECILWDHPSSWFIMSNEYILPGLHRSMNTGVKDILGFY